MITTTMDHPEKITRTFRGVVVSTKMTKTAVVRVDRITMHPMYRKNMMTHRRYKVHDPKQEAHVGDVVRFIETRPISKEKRWRITEILERASS